MAPHISGRRSFHVPGTGIPGGSGPAHQLPELSGVWWRKCYGKVFILVQGTCRSPVRCFLHAFAGAIPGAGQTVPRRTLWAGSMILTEHLYSHRVSKCPFLRNLFETNLSDLTCPFLTFLLLLYATHVFKCSLCRTSLLEDTLGRGALREV